MTLIPISRKEFEAGMNQRTRIVYDFLKNHPDQAFTSTEIALAVRLERSETVSILNYLFISFSPPFIERQKIVDTYYYSIGKEEEE